MKFKLFLKIIGFLIFIALLYYESKLIEVVKNEHKIRDNKKVEFLKDIDSVYKAREVDFYKKI